MFCPERSPLLKPGRAESLRCGQNRSASCLAIRVLPMDFDSTMPCSLGALVTSFALRAILNGIWPPTSLSCLKSGAALSEARVEAKID